MLKYIILKKYDFRYIYIIFQYKFIIIIMNIFIIFYDRCIIQYIVYYNKIYIYNILI